MHNKLTVSVIIIFSLAILFGFSDFCSAKAIQWHDISKPLESDKGYIFSGTTPLYINVEIPENVIHGNKKLLLMLGLDIGDNTNCSLRVNNKYYYALTTSTSKLK
jgi:hypothetical protein